MMNPGEISNDELLRRLRGHNYSAPPITPSTRGVLIKKLSQLDAQQKLKARTARVSTTNGSSSKRLNLLDYSSGEEDVPQTSGGVRKRTSNTFRTPAVPPVKTATVSKSNGHTRPAPTSGRLMNYSETEDDEDDFEDEADEDVGDEEEDDEEDDDEIDDEDDDEEENFRDLGVQTSPRLDDTSLSNGSGGPHGNDGGRFRFKSSTPLHFVKSTSSYLNNPGSVSRPATSTPNLSTASPLRRAIAKNEKAFGSLGEALDSLPRNNGPSPPATSGPSSTSTPQTTISPSTSSQTNTKLEVKPTATTTAAAVAPTLTSRESKSEYLNKNSGFCNSHSVSKLIILVVGLFFFFLFYKYTTLRPNFDVRQRLPICPQDGSDPNTPCVHFDQVDDAVDLYKMIYDFLESFQSCPDWESVAEKSSAEPTATLTLAQIRKDISTMDGWSGLNSGLDDDDDVPKQRGDILQRLINILEANPDLGIKVVPGVDFGGTELAISQPRIQWGCWILQKLNLAFQFGALMLWWVLLLCGILILAYIGYRIYVWNKERILQEKQEVFELVEQVLSILVNQHQASLRGGVVARPYLAINHIRDQLISPQDRKSKKRHWDKVVQYIRESESRVREEVQVIYGEENRVWRWIPDISWGNHNGPNPYLSPTASPTGFPPVSPLSSFLASPSTSSAASTSSSSWQGSAFSSLNKNVAAPSVAPTSCLKVRHMFDRQSMAARNRGSTTAWVWHVKEEILQRCSNSHILHIAVDTESSEGCVYIKSKNTEEAAKVFSALHGQWYGGSLVTVKYMREERYHERFPDSKHQNTPLRPAAPKLKPL